MKGKEETKKTQRYNKHNRGRSIGVYTKVGGEGTQVVLVSDNTQLADGQLGHDRYLAK